MSEGPNQSLNAVVVAQRLASAVQSRGWDYALGGALALGYWGQPRGTVDVDLTLFVSCDRPTECIWLLQEIGCNVSAAEAAASLRAHGFCRATFGQLRVDVFLPIIAFYEAARARRKRVRLGDQPVMIWDAESLAVFKMMFFRRKDVADVEQILRAQGRHFDRVWVREQLTEICGPGDPRLAEWDRLAEDVVGT